ncbi:GspE/PulE family protein [uncultured Treponema sp.]|uniref:GspE/PulE family protein n=1 Tax=uncultured Treponema sp. TaxID=162155 RepID=UPI0025E88F38|nr:ATPase, T2SS/T4P/T4SS family [uncultured Treponema sp.]
MSDKFDLSVSFSLFNDAVVLESMEKFVKIGIRDFANEELKRKLSKSVQNYFEMKGKRFDVASSCRFVPIDDEKLRHEISLRYAESCRVNERKNDASEAGMLLDTLLSEAGKKEASDIHIEEKCVRFRVAGRLEEICPLSPEKSRELVRRIKILSNLNVLESRRAQDGQFIFRGKDEVFVRVSCVPSVSGNGAGESVVLRLLNVSRVPLSLSELGFSESHCALLEKVLENEQGLVLICGATGSGKSTTAASLLTRLNELSCGKKKIITIEDPPEYLLDGMTQIHVDEQNGMSFSDALRFVFRQDPDVIFVGEIRDALAARTVLQASLTGHLVFATVHTGGIQETEVRMKELGVDFSEFSTVLKAMIFQRLMPDENGVHLEAQIVLPEQRGNE